ncbi:MAG: T9SS type A sorting domain-containing protein [Muribaculaceae bacterium]|jgi:hypothetical protein|nr:T9SS type A sorting domain-containing protein [Muribaculaceae bacterium]
MKKIILFLLMIIAFAGAQAQNAIVLKMKDGTKNVVYLRGPETSPTMVPYVTFEEGDVVIRGDHELRMAMADVQNYVYTDTPNGIATIGGTTPIVQFKQNEISIARQPQGTEAAVYTVGGSLVRSVACQGGDATISLDDLPQGVYLIKVGSVTYKFLKR